MKNISIAILVAVVICSGCESPTEIANEPPLATEWSAYADPAAAGWSQELLDVAFAEADQMGSGAVMIIQGDAVVAAWGDVERQFRAHSIRKMLLSALIGIAVNEGQISLEATLEELGIDELDALTAEEKSATVEHLLMSASGIYHPAVSQDDELPPHGSQAPGAVFWYNNWDFNTLGRIYNQETNEDLFLMLSDRIAAPLSMQDFRLEHTYYDYSRSKSLSPAYHLRMSARDLARFGLMMMHQGVWRGEQVVPADWVANSMRAHISAGENKSFGYMWWVLEKGFFADHPDVEAVLASGTGGQRLIILPALDVVIVHRADTDFARGVPTTWPLINTILSARVGEVDDAAEVTPLSVQRFSSSLPPLNLPEPIVLPAELLQKYAGVYETEAGPDVPAGIEVHVNKMEDFLILSIPAAEIEADFFPESEAVFYAGPSRVQMKFESDGDSIAGLTIEDPSDGQVIRALRVVR